MAVYAYMNLSHGHRIVYSPGMPVLLSPPASDELVVGLAGLRAS
jgi:hypothetical protein